MFHIQRKQCELLMLLLFLLFSGLFVLWFLWESGGTIRFPHWETVNDHHYYQLISRDLLPQYLLAVLAVDGVAVALTLWGLRRRAYLAGFAVCLAALLLVSVTIQVFFEGYGKHLLTLLFSGAAAAAALFLSRSRPTWQILGIPLTRLVAGAIVLLSLLGPLLGRDVNGAKAWLRLGGLSLQPGQILLPLLIWYAAAQFPCRSWREIRGFFLLSLLSIASLCLSKDLGGAGILVLLMIIACWYLTDKLTLCGGLVSCFAAGGLLCLQLRREAILSRFRLFQAFDDPGSQQYNVLYALLHSGFHGSGVAPESQYDLATTVTYAQNDLASLLPLAILGLGAMVLTLLAFAGLLLGPVSNPAASPYHVVLHSGATAVLFAQGILNLGGSLNVLPFTGVCFPLLSTGGSALLSTGAMLGFCLSAMVYGGAGSRPAQEKVLTLSLLRQSRKLPPLFRK